MKDMWDSLVESPSWSEFRRIAWWWMTASKYRPSLRFRLKVISHAAKTKITRNLFGTNDR